MRRVDVFARREQGVGTNCSRRRPRFAPEAMPIDAFGMATMGNGWQQGGCVPGPEEVFEGASPVQRSARLVTRWIQDCVGRTGEFDLPPFWNASSWIVLGSRRRSRRLGGVPRTRFKPLHLLQGPQRRPDPVACQAGRHHLQTAHSGATDVAQLVWPTRYRWRH